MKPAKKKNMKDRTQVYNPLVGRYIKKDATTGRFMKQKKDGTKFKRVTKPRKPKSKTTK